MSEPGWRVRRAGPADIGRLALVGAAAFLDTFADVLDGEAVVAHCLTANAPEAYAGYLANGAAAWLAETATRAPVGFALLTASDLPGASADDLEVKRIYLLSRFHGTGMGRALMEAAAQEAGARGAGRLLLGVYRQNWRAIAFYRKQGFVDAGERQFRVGDSVYDDLVLARPLT